MLVFYYFGAFFIILDSLIKITFFFTITSINAIVLHYFSVVFELFVIIFILILYYCNYLLFVLLLFLLVIYTYVGSIPPALKFCLMTRPLLLIMMMSLPAHALLQHRPSKIHRRLLHVHSVNDQWRG